MPETANQPEQPASQGLSIASLTLGILAIVTCLVWYIGIILGILAVVFGVVSLKRRRSKKAIAGIVTGSVGIILSVLIICLLLAGIPSLQKSQQDTSRKNDISVLASNVLSYQTENQGRLPSAGDLSTSGLAQVKSLAGEGEPTTEMAVYKTGVNCEGTASARAYSVTILLENGSPYCQGS